MVEEFKGVIKEEDMVIYKHALNHLKRRLLAFRNNDLIEKLGLVEEVGEDISFEISQIDELLRYALPNVEGFGVGKREKIGVYNRIVNSAFKQFKADLLKMKEEINRDLSESKLRLADIEDSLSEVERILSTYKFLESK